MLSAQTTHYKHTVQRTCQGSVTQCFSSLLLSNCSRDQPESVLHNKYAMLMKQLHTVWFHNHQKQPAAATDYHCLLDWGKQANTLFDTVFMVYFCKDRQIHILQAICHCAVSHYFCRACDYLSTVCTAETLTSQSTCRLCAATLKSHWAYC